MSFVRCVLTSRHPDSGVEDGIFRAAYRLRDDGFDSFAPSTALMGFERFSPILLHSALHRRECS